MREDINVLAEVGSLIFTWSTRGSLFNSSKVTEELDYIDELLMKGRKAKGYTECGELRNITKLLVAEVEGENDPNKILAIHNTLINEYLNKIEKMGYPNYLYITDTIAQMVVSELHGARALRGKDKAVISTHLTALVSSMNTAYPNICNHLTEKADEILIASERLTIPVSMNKTKEPLVTSNIFNAQEGVIHNYRSGEYFVVGNRSLSESPVQPKLERVVKAMVDGLVLMAPHADLMFALPGVSHDTGELQKALEAEIHEKLPEYKIHYWNKVNPRLPKGKVIVFDQDDIPLIPNKSQDYAIIECLCGEQLDISFCPASANGPVKLPYDERHKVAFITKADPTVKRYYFTAHPEVKALDRETGELTSDMINGSISLVDRQLNRLVTEAITQKMDYVVNILRNEEDANAMWIGDITKRNYADNRLVNVFRTR